MNSLKIALYCPNKPLAHPVPSGDQTIARNLQTALNRMGHDCRELTRFRSRWFWRSREGWSNAVRCLFQGFRRVAAWGPQIWLTYHTYYKSPDVIGPVLCRSRAIPYVLFQPMFATKWRRIPEARIGYHLNRFALASACHAFTNNLTDMEGLRRSLPAARITYLAPGIFPEEFPRDPVAGSSLRESLGIKTSTPLLLTVARFRADVKAQSLHYLFRALIHLQDRAPFRLLVVGDGPAENELRTAAERCLPGRVIFSGKVARNRLFAYYSAADLFVFPGIGESLGMVYLEAQACGCPVVALHSEGVAQVVENGKTGLLARFDDGSSLAEAVHRLLRNQELRSRLGANAQRFIREQRNLNHNYRLLAARLETLGRTRTDTGSREPEKFARSS